MMRGGGHWRPEEPPRATDVRGTLSRLLGYFRPYWALFVGAAVLIVTTTLLRLLPPYLSGLAVDHFIAPSGQPRPGWLTWLVGEGASPVTGLTIMMVTLLVADLVNWAGSSLQIYLMTVAGQRVLFRLRTEIFQRIQSLSLRFFDQREAGDLMSRLVNDTQVINDVFSGGIVRLASLSLSIVGIIASMLSLNWRLALASFVVLPFMVVATRLFSRRTRAAFRRTRKTIGQVSAELQENIAGVREVQAFARERLNVQEFQSVNAANRDANVQAQSIMSAFFPALDVLSIIALAIVAGVGGYLVVGFTPPLASIGVIVAFLQYVRRFYDPIRMIAQLWAQLQSAIAGAERVFDLLDTQPEITEKPDAIPLPPVRGKVEFEHVSFAYEADKPVLQDISLLAQPGQTIALVGPTGVGKTTIVSLLCRFYDVSAGAIRIDDHDIRSVKLDSLRRQIGIVLQDTFLFSGSVMDNIRYGRLDASDEEVIAAARLANADSFITRLPEGYATLLGERGHTLSQGQRQLIAIARAVLADPRILVLDEATSNVDTHTEALIQRALEDLLRGRTSFVIAHRLSTVRNADCVYMLEEGRIVESGTHEELLAARGRYYTLYDSQFRREAPTELRPVHG